MLSYNIALCHYELGEYDKALTLVEDIFGNGEDEPEISKDSYIVEAINLEAAILHSTEKFDVAKEILSSTFDDNLDSVTIHNDVIANSQTDPLVAMQKHDFLLSSEQFPPETLSNLLTLYTSHGQDNLAAETMSTHKHVAKELLPPEVYSYFDALLMSTTSPLDARELLTVQMAKYLPKLRVGKREVTSDNSTRPATNQHRPATSAAQRPTTALERKQHAHTETKQAELKAILEYYIPTLMLQSKIYFDQKDYSASEKVLHKASFCSDNDAYQINLANIMFAEGKFEESIEHFTLLLKHHAEADILKISPLALANLCVAYLITDQNKKGEEIIKRVERQELLLGDTDEPTYHSCIINLVIGTLYCGRGNYVFGIERVCKSLEPCEKNLSLDTWVYARKWFLHLASVISKLMTHISSETIQEVICFLDDVERHGEHIVTTDIDDEESDLLNPIMETSTIATEARQLQNLFIKVGA